MTNENRRRKPMQITLEPETREWIERRSKQLGITHSSYLEGLANADKEKGRSVKNMTRIRVDPDDGEISVGGCGCCGTTHYLRSEADEQFGSDWADDYPERILTQAFIDECRFDLKVELALLDKLEQRFKEETQ